MIIYLIGYMGAGKTTFGKQIARKLGMTFIDSDDYIVEKFHSSINEIFEIHGEKEFRKMEREALEEISLQENAVVATGGGLPCFYDNMAYMKKHGICVYLKVDENELADRLDSIKASRPLLKDKSREELKQSVHDMLQTREPYYNRANIIVDATDETNAADMIVMSLKPYMEK